eukprot:TRINITY_DN36489_c0_g1_i1.p1 TRINITY_DN36489_c0_g1~~TRINITY_DN36489_c0_g1_i1.p1  ORF type:complete len:267 (+),score=67.39 TRINITY_DN36489_c0_g1_i1:64-864(+)
MAAVAARSAGYGTTFHDKQFSSGLQKVASQLDQLSHKFSKQVKSLGQPIRSLKTCTSLPLLLTGDKSFTPLWHRPKAALTAKSLPPLQHSASVGAAGFVVEDSLLRPTTPVKEGKSVEQEGNTCASPSGARKKSNRLIFGGLNRRASEGQLWAGSLGAKVVAPKIPTLDLQKVTASVAGEFDEFDPGIDVPDEVQKRRVRPGDSLLLWLADEADEMDMNDLALEGADLDNMDGHVKDILTDVYTVAVSCSPAQQDTEYDGFEEEEV